MRRKIAAGILSISSAAASTVVGMTWPALDPHIGIPVLVLCGLGILVGIAMWFWPTPERNKARDKSIHAIIVAAEDRLKVVKGRIRYAETAKRRSGEFLDDWLDKVRADTQGVAPEELGQLRGEAVPLLTDKENAAYKTGLTELDELNVFSSWARNSTRPPERIAHTYLSRAQKAGEALEKLIAHLRAAPSN